MRIDAEKWRSWRGMERLLDALGGDVGFTRFVGGAVRDDLLCLPVSDVDLATQLEPLKVIERLKRSNIKAVPTGIQHGTITAVSDGLPYEITTLRRDVTTDGRRATVAFTSVWEEDAGRRDFTINALFADPESGEIFDYFQGIEDLLARRVRFIGDPLKRIAEDHLRILRYFRFHARFGTESFDQSALDACTARSNDLMALSRERIADELLKLLTLADPTKTVKIMIERKILSPVLPEIGFDGLFSLERLIAAEKVANIAPEGLRRLAALLPPDPRVGEAVAVRLKLSTKARRRLSCAVKRELQSSSQALAYRCGIACALDRLLIAGKAKDAAEIESWLPPRLPIGGGILIARGVPEGPAVARTLRRIEQRWIEEGFPADDALEAIICDELASAKGRDGGS